MHSDVRVSLPVTIVVVAVVCAACGSDGPGGGQRLPAADAAKLPTSGELWSLCPVPDAPQAFRERVARSALRQARALIREVRRRPDALVTLHYEDSHSGEPFTETKTVRALALEHLDNPGIKGVPCRRQVMAELQAAVDGRAAPTSRTSGPTRWTTSSPDCDSKTTADVHQPRRLPGAGPLLPARRGRGRARGADPRQRGHHLAPTPRRREGVQARPSLPRRHRARSRTARFRVKGVCACRPRSTEWSARQQHVRSGR